MKAAIIIVALLLPWSSCTPINPRTNHTTQSASFATDTLVIDTFHNQTYNDLGHWHGAEEDLPVEHGPGYVHLYPSDADHSFYTQLATSTCTNLKPYRKHYLHLVFSGTTYFSISLTQHNGSCDPSRRRYPATWDSVEAARYAVPDKNEIYVPIEHFHVDLSRVVSISVHGFFTNEALTLRKIELVPPNHKLSLRVPPKLESGRLVLHCTRPNSFAFGIDDGKPEFAGEVMRILEEEGILVTFFAVGNGLREPTANFSRVYTEVLKRGHQLALHSVSHPKMEGLPSIDNIDAEISGSTAALRDVLARYFRPPFGTVGARMRQRLAALIHDPIIVNWSVDVEDWLWAGTGTPEKQMDAFVRDVVRGGNLLVMHYLDPSTVRYFREFIHFVKAAGFDIMRVDQCMEDPASPAFVKSYH